MDQGLITSLNFMCFKATPTVVVVLGSAVSEKWLGCEDRALVSSVKEN